MAEGRMRGTMKKRHRFYIVPLTLALSPQGRGDKATLALTSPREGTKPPDNNSNY